MQMSTEETGIKIRDAPIENPGSIGEVKRYHAPLRKKYELIRR